MYGKGAVGNPGGVIKLPPELRQARRENMEQLIQLIHKYMALTKEQAEQRMAGNEALLIEEMIMGQINKAATGDANSFKFLIEIMCGKIPESDDTPTADSMTPQEKLELMEKATEALRAQIGASTSTISD